MYDVGNGLYRIPSVNADLIEAMEAARDNQYDVLIGSPPGGAMATFRVERVERDGKTAEIFVRQLQ